MEFEWDEARNQTNVRKHGIGIVSVADDPEVDVARDHDDVLADCEIASCPGPPPPHEDRPG